MCHKIAHGHLTRLQRSEGYTPRRFSPKKATPLKRGARSAYIEEVPLLRGVALFLKKCRGVYYFLRYGVPKEPLKTQITGPMKPHENSMA